MTWSDTEAALWELRAMGVGPEQVWRDPDGHARGDAYGATADEMWRMADLLGRLDAGRVPLPKGPAGPAKFETLNSYEDEARIKAWLLDGGADDLKLTYVARAVLRELAAYANSKTGLAWPGNDTLATLLGVHPVSIERSLKRLREADLIATVERATGQRRARHRLTGPILKVAQPSVGATSESGTTEDVEWHNPALGVAQPSVGADLVRTKKDQSGTEADPSMNEVIPADVLGEVQSSRSMDSSEATRLIRYWMDQAPEPVRLVGPYVRGCLARVGPDEIREFRYRAAFAAAEADIESESPCPKCGEPGRADTIVRNGECWGCTTAPALSHEVGP